MGKSPRTEPTTAIRLCGVVVLLLVTAMTMTGAEATSPPAPLHRRPRILLLHSYHEGLAWTDQITAAVKRELGERHEIYVEHLDSKRRHSNPGEEPLLALFAARGDAGEFALAITCDNAALEFAQRERPRLFPRTPIVFCGVNRFRPPMIGPGVTGVAEATACRPTFELLRKLHPRVKRCVVIGDETETGAAELRAARDELGDVFDGVRMEYWSRLTFEELAERLAALDPQRDAVILTAFNRDAAGRWLEHADAGRLVASAAGCPVYGLWDFYLGTGVLGGHMVSGPEQGRAAAELARQVLAGESVDALPVRTQTPHTTFFDYQSLRDAGLSLSHIPPGSTVVEYGQPIYVADDDPVRRLGVLIETDAAACHRDWAATADFLTRRVSRLRFELVPLQRHDIKAAIRDKTIDYLLADPATQIEWGRLCPTTPVASVHRSGSLFDGRTAATVFVRADSSLVDWSDLSNRKIAATRSTAWSWRMAAREFLRRGWSQTELKAATFLGSPEAVRRAVAEGNGEIGVVRADEFARWGGESSSAFRVLPPPAPDERPVGSLAGSTPLYPDWGLIQIARAADAESGAVAAALFSMSADERADMAARRQGWGMTPSLSDVEECLRDLGIDPGGAGRDIFLADFVGQYWLHLIGASTLLVVVTVSVTLLLSLHERIRGLASDLSASEELIAATLRSTIEAVISTDADGNVTGWNPAAEEMLGRTAAETLGQPVESLITAPDGRIGVAEVLSTGRSTHLESARIGGDPGQPLREVCGSISAIRDDAGDVIGAVLVLVDVTQRRRDEAALRENEALFRAVIDTSPDLIWLKSDSGAYLTCNRRFAAFLGATEEEILGRTDYDFVDQEMADFFRANDRAALAAGSPRRNEEEVVFADGHCEILETIKVPVRSTGGRLVGVLGVGRDITGRKSTELALREREQQLEQTVAALESTNRALAESNEKAQAATRAKSEFLANMSHEIRTPMTAILGFTDILLSEGDLEQAPPERVESLQIIRRNGEYLLQLINDILDLSKIEAGKLQVEQVVCSPSRILDDVAALMRVRAEQQGIDLVFETRTPLPERIESDPIRLRQVLINLVGNGIKFTEQGSVRVVASLDSDPDEPQLKVEVQDTGIGMSATQLTKLFQPFSQADSSTTRRFGGTGLGLAISGRLAELLGGKITVKSKLGEGAVFTLTVATGSLSEVSWVRSDAESAPSPTKPVGDPVSVAEPTGAEQTRVLLAEDGPDNQRLLGAILRKSGVELTIVENGVLAVEAASAAMAQGRAFHVILMDMQMPRMDGYEATRQLREAGYTGPIVALTAHAMDGEAQKCLDAGCDGYASKPIRRETLLQVVADYAARSVASRPTP